VVKVFLLAQVRDDLQSVMQLYLVYPRWRRQAKSSGSVKRNSCTCFENLHLEDKSLRRLITARIEALELEKPSWKFAEATAIPC